MRKHIVLPAALTSIVGASLSVASAADLEVRVEIPRMNVAEYHRPYVAMWIEREDQTFVGNLAVWYDLQTNKNEKGTTWLKDLRQWWRKAGRELTLPVDGVSGATRPPGAQVAAFRGNRTPLSNLAPGSYRLVVEAAREVGGRELLRIPFQWPASANASAKAQGQSELGQVQVNIKP
jgi:hypothetical protein